MLGPKGVVAIWDALRVKLAGQSQAFAFVVWLPEGADEPVCKHKVVLKIGSVSFAPCLFPS